MKKIIFLLLIIISFNAFSQINSPNGSNVFTYNGLADVIFRFPERGSGGRAFVHDNNNILSLNYSEDFTGGTRIGKDVYFKDGGNSYIYSGNFGIGTNNPSAPLTVYGKSHFFPARIGSGDGRVLEIGHTASFPAFLDNNYPVFLKTGGGNQPLILDAARVGIGTANPDSQLAVNGTIHSKEVKVDMSGWSDFVFKKQYNLPTLQEVEKHIAEKGHLENIPTEKEVLENGINLGEMNAKLLQKIEELTLYSIQQNKKIDEQSKEIESLKDLVLRVAKIENELGKK